MSKQVNFYALPEDLREFEKTLVHSTDVFFIDPDSCDSTIRKIDSLEIPEMGKSNLKIYLAQKSVLSEVKMQFVSDSVGWSIDVLRSPVIEMIRCYYDGNLLRRGRLFYYAGFYLENGDWLEKSSDFVKWANQILKWIRKNYNRDKATGFYIGPNAEKAYNSGTLHLAVL